LIAPYFLFTGVLMERIHKLAEGFRAAHPDVRFIVSMYFEFHDRLLEVVEARIRGALEGEGMMACETCTYRIAAAGDAHHHHHHH
jgi:sirohydrochlorin cobaltochelatase